MNDAILNQGYCHRIIIIVSILCYSLVLAGDKRIEYKNIISQKDEKIGLYQTYIDRGNVYNDKDQIDRAIEEYRKAIDFNPMDPIGYYLRGNSFLKKRNYERAMKDYGRALALKPQRSIAYRAHLNLGIIYANKGKQEESIEEYGKAIKINPRDPWAYRLRGSTYYKMGQYEKAITDLRRTVALDSEHSDIYAGLSHIHYHYGNFLKRKGQYDKAIEEYSAAIALAPNDPHLYAGRGYAYFLKGDNKSAMIDLKKACDLGDKNGCRILEVLKTKLPP